MPHPAICTKHEISLQKYKDYVNKSNIDVISGSELLTEVHVCTMVKKGLIDKTLLQRVAKIPYYCNPTKLIECSEDF